MSKGECITKRQLYFNQPCLSRRIPVRTRVLHCSTELLGFVCQRPCPMNNDDRYLIVFDDFTAYYYTESTFRLCLCQDFRRHLSNIDNRQLRAHYQHIFQSKYVSYQPTFVRNQIIRVRKFGDQYHRARILDIDCSIIRICFFERRTAKQMWIYANSSIIEQESTSISIDVHLSIDNDNRPTNSDSICLRKRKRTTRETNQGWSISISDVAIYMKHNEQFFLFVLRTCSPIELLAYILIIVSTSATVC
jgi:hypothetical protein